MARLRAFIVFVLSLTLYLVCLDPGASLWDCPEYVLVAWGLEVGHPPGNPTWQLMANVVSHLGGSPQHAALLINITSAVAMALAATLLCQITYILLRYAILRHGRRYRLAASWCAVCGSLCYAWCDSAIFSAVEAEVYALSALFTALTIWLALRWALARVAGRRRKASRIAILTWYVMGLSIGVHELNLLALPAMGLIYWFALKTSSRRGPYHLIPRPGSLRTILCGILFFLIGCSTYLILPIRAGANPPVNQGDPSTWAAFKAYYTREQYGSKPLLYGPTLYSRPLMLEEVDSQGRYFYDRHFLRETTSGRKEYVYPDELNMWLPRMTSPTHIESYKAWTGMEEEDMVKVYPSYAVDSLGRQVDRMDNSTGVRVKGEESFRPTYMQQLRYMMGYQIGYMYLRYLMWNFAGRQNNMPSTGEIDHGNFITGIDPIDDLMLGAQSSLPRELKEDNRGYNRYFLIPFMFGVLGACWLPAFGRRGRRVLAVVGAFFFFTGIAIVVYLNQDPGEPRERDYSFLGSFMAFSIWIACAFATIWQWLLSRPWSRIHRCSALIPLLLALVTAAVPLLILSQTYDDHNRSGRNVAVAIGTNILGSLAPNAVIFVDGDNIIFPLWYVQEVLGLRRDVTVVEVGYLPTEWYRRQLPFGAASDTALKPVSSVAGAIDEIIRWNDSQPVRRPVYWHASLAGRPYFQKRERQADLSLFTYKLREEGADTVASRRIAIAEGIAAMQGLISGGTENPHFYSEPYVTEELGRMRRAMFRLSWHVRQDGDTVMADSIARVAQRLWPFGKVPPDGRDSQPSSMKDRRRREFRRYYDAVPSSRRHAISRRSLDIIE